MNQETLEKVKAEILEELKNWKNGTYKLATLGILESEGYRNGKISAYESTLSIIIKHERNETE